MNKRNKTYLGDGVYVAFDGYMLILTTEDGTYPPRNIVHLEPEVYGQLVKYVERLKGEKEKPRMGYPEIPDN